MKYSVTFCENILAKSMTALVCLSLYLFDKHVKNQIGKNILAIKDAKQTKAPRALVHAVLPRVHDSKLYFFCSFLPGNLLGNKFILL
jgi:hypothetical protein